MRRLVILAAVLFLTTTSLAAQSSIWLGAGPTFPTGSYGDYAKTGWMATAGFGLPLGQSKASLGFEGLFGSNSHSDIAGDKTSLYGGMLDLTYRLGNVDKMGLYVFGGGGLLVHKYSSDTYGGSSDSKFAYQFGAGLDIPMSKVSLWVDVRYLARAESNATSLIPIMAGISIPLGKK